MAAGNSLTVGAGTTTWTGGTNSGTLASTNGTLNVAGTLANSGGILQGPTGTQTGTLSINSATVSGGTLQGAMTSKGSSFSGVTLASGASLTSGAGGATTWNGGTVVGTLYTGSAVLNLTGSITNQGGIHNVGAGTLNNSGTVTGGTIDVATLGSMNNTGTLQSAAWSNMTINGTGGGTLNNSGGSITVTGGTLTLQGNLTVNGGTITGTASHAVTANGGAILNGVSFSNLSMSTGALTGTNTITGGTNTITGATIAGSTLNITNGTNTLSNLTDGTGSLVNISGGANTMSGTFTNAGGSDTYSLSGGTLTLNGASFNGQTLSQSNGTLDIEGTVDPLGSYTLSGGTLDLNPSSLFTVGTVTMSSGTVEGTGQIEATTLTSNVGLDQSEVDGGIGRGSTTLTTMTLGDGSVFDVTPQTSTNDYNPNETYVNGTLTLGGELNLGSFDLLPEYPQTSFTPYVFPIFEANVVVGQFSTVCFDNGAICDAPNALPTYWSLDVVRLANGGEQVDLMNTPEPGTCLMIGGALLCLGLLGRRRRINATVGRN